MSHDAPTHLDLFSGIGGFALAAQWAGFRTVGFCEIEPYCQALIKERFGACSDSEQSGLEGIAGKGLPSSRRPSVKSPRIHSDIFTLSGTSYLGVDLITGGFPCQPFSVAGKRRGAADDRAIWPQMLRVIAEARPSWVLAENVPGIINMELDRVLSDLGAVGYSVGTLVIPACAADAKHRRYRVWIMGHADQGGIRRAGTPWEQGHTAFASQTQPDTGCELLERWSGEPAQGPTQWIPEPAVGRVAHGVPRRVDRLKGLGNAIVPQVAYQILREIRKLIG